MTGAEREHADRSGPLAEAFTAEHGQALIKYGWLLTHGHDAAAQDLVQSALTKMLAHGFDRITYPLAFARQAMTNEIRDQSRRRSVHLRALPTLQADEHVRTHVAASSPPVDSVLERNELFAALRHLNQREQIVVVCRYYEDMTDAEIAELLDCGTSTVRSLARRGLRKLREQLEPDLGVDPDPHPDPHPDVRDHRVPAPERENHDRTRTDNGLEEETR